MQDATSKDGDTQPPRTGHISVTATGMSRSEQRGLSCSPPAGGGEMERGIHETTTGKEQASLLQ